MIKNDDKENNESINSTDTPSNKQANNENINYNDMFKVMFTSMTQMMNMMNTKNEQMMNIMNSLMETINNNNIKKENNELKNIINDLKNTFKLKNNLENLDYWLTKRFRYKKSEEKILESIYHSLPSDLSQEFHGNIGSSDKPIKNITLLIKFIRQKKQEEYNKKYNQKNITTLQRYRDQANNINGED
ncbi:hypothetical protein LY90DRAFT_518256 [Neocallimastix californiae]|uniref:Uncharacterized protein n=1 Tax=Neocallimastix californiae TaxID=1754190 RepID=A0A1Y1ZS29_9FUNG|nr:hypothetical protein LY90DRAFT_518256 [Neocallimastix californiae]|eukprot:ORY13008.1 hypothetical protein LY90DRAFT_518256 [Neocallimastix californiae]